MSNKRYVKEHQAGIRGDEADMVQLVDLIVAISALPDYVFGSETL
jgi:hypothetical protein